MFKQQDLQMFQRIYTEIHENKLSYTPKYNNECHLEKTAVNFINLQIKCYDVLIKNNTN